MAHDQNRLLRPISLQSRDQVGAAWFAREDLIIYPLAIKDVLQIVDHGGFVARWIACIKPDNRLEVEENFGLSLVPIHNGLGGPSYEP